MTSAASRTAGRPRGRPGRPPYHRRGGGRGRTRPPWRSPRAPLRREPPACGTWPGGTGPPRPPRPPGRGAPRRRRPAPPGPARRAAPRRRPPPAPSRAPAATATAPPGRRGVPPSRPVGDGAAARRAHPPPRGPGRGSPRRARAGPVAGPRPAAGAAGTRGPPRPRGARRPRPAREPRPPRRPAPDRAGSLRPGPPASSRLDHEGGLGQHARVERQVVGGDELHLDHVRARIQLGQLAGELVVHGHQLVVDEHVDVALARLDVARG